MKLQKILALFLFFAFLGVCFMLCGFTFFKNENKVENLQKVQTSTNYSDAKDNLWCVTFQLVWNDFMDKVNNGQPIKFVGGNPTIADELNKKSYTTDILKDEDYFKTQGFICVFCPFGKIATKIYCASFSHCFRIGKQSDSLNKR